jgi:hypothetical protein
VQGDRLRQVVYAPSSSLSQCHVVRPLENFDQVSLDGVTTHAKAEVHLLARPFAQRAVNFKDFHGYGPPHG